MNCSLQTVQHSTQARRPISRENEEGSDYAAFFNLPGYYGVGTVYGATGVSGVANQPNCTAQ